MPRARSCPAAALGLALTLVGCSAGASVAPAGAGSSSAVTVGPPGASGSGPRSVAPSAAYPMQVRRTGGFAGVNDLVQITADHVVTVIPTRGAGYSCRLGTADAAALDQLLVAADWAPAPRPTPTVMDAFVHTASSPLGGPKVVDAAGFGPGALTLTGLVDELVGAPGPGVRCTTLRP